MASTEPFWFLVMSTLPVWLITASERRSVIAVTFRLPWDERRSVSAVRFWLITWTMSCDHYLIWLSSDERRPYYCNPSLTVAELRLRCGRCPILTAACLTNTVPHYQLDHQMNGGLSDKHGLTLSALLSDERQPMTPVSIYSLQKFNISWKEPSHVVFI